jgi:hypothetical protein
MNIGRITGLLFASFLILAVVQDLRADSSDVNELILRAEVLLKIGAGEHGAGRSLQEAEALLEHAADELSRADISLVEKDALERQLTAIREDLDIVTELNDERFFGVFPLVRLTVPNLAEDEGLALTEQLFHAPDVAATMKAATGVNKSLGAYRNPQVVWRSEPPDRRLENLAAEVLRGKHAWSHSRRSLVAVLSPQELDAFDSGAITPELIDHIRKSFGVVNLVVLNLKQPVEIEHGATVTIIGDMYSPGEVILGSPLEATLSLRVESFSNVGYAFDRRDQFLPLVVTQVLLFLLALVWGSRVKWSIGEPLSLTLRLATGAGFYLFGRFFMIGTIWLMHRHMPEETDLMISSLWWPMLIGAMGIVLVGLIAWMGQARVTAIIAGARGARAVGSIFALTALGSASYFVMPLFLLDESRGLASLFPYVVSTLSLALVSGLAARTGPPIPHYFIIFTSLIASRLWGVAGLSLTVCGVAWLRHRVAAAQGWEETEPTEAQAVKTDSERLLKLRSKLLRK